MEPMSIIVGALTAGATAAGKDVASQAVKDAYAGLKQLIIRKFGSRAEVEDALVKVETVPKSEARKGFLKEELERAEAGNDGEVLGLAKSFLELLKDQGIAVPSYHAALKGDGAIAQGPGAVAAGKGGVVVGGDVEGNIVTGDGNVVGSSGRDQSNREE